jgi:hypothetical protein
MKWHGLGSRRPGRRTCAPLLSAPALAIAKRPAPPAGNHVSEPGNKLVGTLGVRIRVAALYPPLPPYSLGQCISCNSSSDRRMFCTYRIPHTKVCARLEMSTVTACVKSNRTSGVGTAFARMLDFEVLVLEPVAKRGLAPSPVGHGEVTPLHLHGVQYW